MGPKRLVWPVAVPSRPTPAPKPMTGSKRTVLVWAKKPSTTWSRTGGNQSAVVTALMSQPTSTNLWIHRPMKSTTSRLLLGLQRAVLCSLWCLPPLLFLDNTRYIIWIESHEQRFRSSHTHVITVLRTRGSQRSTLVLNEIFVIPLYE